MAAPVQEDWYGYDEQDDCETAVTDLESKIIKAGSSAVRQCTACSAFPLPAPPCACP